MTHRTFSLLTITQPSSHRVGLYDFEGKRDDGWLIINDYMCVLSSSLVIKAATRVAKGKPEAMKWLWVSALSIFTNIPPFSKIKGLGFDNFICDICGRIRRWLPLPEMSIFAWKTSVLYLLQSKISLFGVAKNLVNDRLPYPIINVSSPLTNLSNDKSRWQLISTKLRLCDEWRLSPYRFIKEISQTFSSLSLTAKESEAEVYRPHSKVQNDGRWRSKRLGFSRKGAHLFFVVSIPRWKRSSKRTHAWSSRLTNRKRNATVNGFPAHCQPHSPFDFNRSSTFAKLFSSQRQLFSR